jgi:multicomponent K+:H+ antiporter subunit E
VRPAAAKFSPVLAIALGGLWLLLNQSVTPGHVALGALLGSALAWASSALRPVQARIGRWDVAWRLAWTVLGDIIRSNVAVARIVLARAPGATRPGFLRIPLELRDPHGLAALAAIITSTPGTIWVGLSGNGETLTLHVLDLDDDARWVRLIKQRYEQPLIEIFE